MNLPSVLAAAALLTTLASAAPPAFAEHEGFNSPCTRASNDMRRSCTAESKEELHVAIANCRQIADRHERRDCFAEARDDRHEALDECGDQLEARLAACELLAEQRYSDPLRDPSIEFIDPDDIPEEHPNSPYVILQAGHTHVLEGDDEIVVVHATDDIREILGVSCRVVVDIVVEASEEDGEVEYEAVEVTDDWFAQDSDQNIYYCGEVAQNFEDGVLRDLDGSFEAGFDLANGGFLTLANPAPMQVHRQEYALGEAEDVVQYIGTGMVPTAEEGGENPNFPCAPAGCLKTFDFAPLEPESTEFKYYIPGVGFVLAIGMEDGEITGERESLVCTGESLDVLEDEACGIADPELLLETLCELHPAFCGDDDDDDEEEDDD